MVAVEAAPLAKVGGLGDYAAALSRYLSLAGHDIRLFIPAHGSIDWADREVEEVESLREVPMRVADRVLRFSGLRSHLPGSPERIYLVDCPALYDRASIYTQDADEALRFAFLTRATIESCRRMGWSPHVFHCNDWHTALLPLYLRSGAGQGGFFADSRTLLTIHNIGYQGVFDAAILDQIGRAELAGKFAGEDLKRGFINLLKAGIEHADFISTVSPTHAREIESEEYGMGLDALLRQRGDVLLGILNGVDYEVWDPARDPLIPHSYRAEDLRGKYRNKRALLSDLSLPLAARTPLLGMVSRLVEQKGVDLLQQVLPDLLQRRELRLVVLGSGESRYESFFSSLRERFPTKFYFHRGYHDQLAHRIEAASDIYLMPSLYEPCGLNQMYSLRYGAVPVVRRTGGLADAVQPFDPHSGAGTGFLFEEFTPAGLQVALEQALDTYPRRRLWRRLVRNGMSQDFSWERQVEEYVALYRRVATSPGPP